MPFAPQDLSAMCYNSGFTLWHYTTPDSDIAAPGYFDAAAPYIRVGDVIVCNTAIDSATPRAGFVMVASNSHQGGDSAAVTVRALSALAAG